MEKIKIIIAKNMDATIEREKITQENIQKFDEEYKLSRIIPKEYKKQSYRK